MQLAIAENTEVLNEALKPARTAGKRIAFVPTMGALHAGHISLIELAKKHADVVVTSIFVNPKQFGPNEDFSKYPRTIDEDIAALNAAKVDTLFLPDASVIYPPAFCTIVSVPTLSNRWCGEVRPGHFDGVVTVVARLFGLVKPDVAIFGEKDFQQLAVIRQMVSDLAVGLEIIGAPIMREADGLAMSSRNRYLSDAERKIAPLLYEAISQAAANARTDNLDAEIEEAKSKLIAAGFNKIDYLACVDAATLEPLDKLQKPARLLAAAWLGATRLIDNVALEL